MLHGIDKVSDNIAITRRRNAAALFQEFLQAEIAAGRPAKGLEQAFAERLQISPSLWSQVKKSRPIGDKLARQVEHHAGKPEGWLDEAHEENAMPDPAEERFIELARKTWRCANAKQKRELARMLKALPAGAPL